MSLLRRLTRLREEPQPGLQDARAAKIGRGLSSLPAMRSRGPAKDPRVDELQSLIDNLVSRQQASLRKETPTAPAGPVIKMPGERRETKFGELRILEQFLEPDHHHGRTPIATALTARPSTVAKLALSPELADVDPNGALYLDTETTGLSIGGGTIPFLVGLAWFDDGALVLEQLVLETPADEPVMLEWLAERVRKATCLVTYNGKTYDWPLLSTRYVLNRMATPPLVAHLDLLHCARRVYKRRLGVVRLVNVEADVLGFRRIDDIDGREIPERYWAFIRGADASQLAPVLEHNANDLVALAALLGKMSGRYDAGAGSDDGRDQFGLARLALRAGDVERAGVFAAAAIAVEDDAAAVEAALLAARLRWRARAFEGSRDVLLEVLPRACAVSAPSVHLALAKLYEHRFGDLGAARRHATEARDAETAEAHQRRIDRLERRIERHANPPPKKKRKRKRPKGELQLL